MTGDGVAQWVELYRSSVVDAPTPMLDQAILSAAARRSAGRRLLRRAGGATIVLAFAMLAAGMAWQRRTPDFQPSRVATDYGRFEVTSRRYLLEHGAYPDIVPGIIEGRP